MFDIVVSGGLAVLPSGADIPNYTHIEPTIQISEVMIWRARRRKIMAYWRGLEDRESSA